MKQLLLVCLLGMVAFCVSAQDRKVKSVVTSQKSQVTATVQNIDRDKRELTVKGPFGTTELKAGEEVRNFDQIKEGDQIALTYYESVALSLAKKGESPNTAKGEGAVYLAAKGEKPGAAAVETTQRTATVQSVDRANHEVTLKGQGGRTIKIKVDEDVADLKNIKEGDEVTAVYTEALAIAVKTPEK